MYRGRVAKESKAKKSVRRGPDAPKGPACSALVLIDGRPIRERIRKEYDRACQDLESARQNLDRFEQHDIPEFARWLSHHFGAALSEIRQLRDRMLRNQQLIDMVEAEVFFCGVSYRTAYRHAVEDMETPPPEEPSDAEDEEESRHAPGSDSQKEFSDFDPGEPPPRPIRRPQKAPRTIASRVKELYRALVRRLHPDTQTIMTARKLEWWHQTQQAYEKGDENQLEMILAWCELEDTAAPTHNVGVLQRIIHQLQRSLRALKSRLRESRNDPAWNFSQLRDRSGKHAEIKKGLEHDLAVLRQACTATDEQLETWKKQPPKRRPQPRVRRRSSPSFDSF